MSLRRTVVSIIAAAGVLAIPVVTPPQPSPRPVTPVVQSITVDLVSAETEVSAAPAPDTGSVPAAPAPDAGSTPAVTPGPSSPVESGAALETPRIEVDDFSLVGVTWPEESGIAAEDLVIEVRTDGGDGWSEWARMPQLEEGPDPDTEEGRRAVETATASLWVDDASAIQTRVRPTEAAAAEAQSPADALPTSVELALVDPGTSAADGQVASTPLATADAATARPSIISRAQWGADESWKNCGYSLNATIKAAVVHHTAGSNAYASAAEAMRQLRADYAYHTNTLGWCDLGYNFVVDKWGNVYEGRAGGVDQPIVGAHASGFNKDTVGVAMLGDFSSLTPSAAMQRSVAQIIAWKLSLYDRDPSGSTQLTSAGGRTSRYPAGQTVTLPVVMAHRDVGYTADPGAGGYPTLPGIRGTATALVVNDSFVRALYQDLLGRPADASGLANWTGQIGTSSANRIKVATSIGNSNEYLNREVDMAYRAVFLRPADRRGIDTWRGWIREGRIGYYDVAVPLMESAEFYQREGSTDRGFIDGVYKTSLGRTSDSAGMSNWLNVLRQQGRRAVIDGIWQSREAHTIRVNTLYVSLLGRSADPSGLSNLTDAATARGDVAARNALIGSAEYVSRAQARY